MAAIVVAVPAGPVGSASVWELAESSRRDNHEFDADLPAVDPNRSTAGLLGSPQSGFTRDRGLFNACPTWACFGGSP
jgi:hypothetical protein